MITSQDAPTTYLYQFDLPEGTTIERDGQGLWFLNGDEVVGGLAPAWAKDAEGREVPTGYEVDGTSVTQIVEHNSAFTCPVVADPWLGIKLIDKVARKKDGSGFVCEVDPSAWARGGSALARGSAWTEAMQKGVPNSGSLKNQFWCHCDYRPITTFKRSWNLESWRNNVGYWSFMASVCNPK